MKARSQKFIEFNVSDILLDTSEKVEPVIDLVTTIGKMVLYYCKINNMLMINCLCYNESKIFKKMFAYKIKNVLQLIWSYD